MPSLSLHICSSGAQIATSSCATKEMACRSIRQRLQHLQSRCCMVGPWSGAKLQLGRAASQDACVTAPFKQFAMQLQFDELRREWQFRHNFAACVAAVSPPLSPPQPLPCRCLSLASHCLSAAIPPSFHRPFRCLSHLLTLTFPCMFSTIRLPLTFDLSPPLDLRPFLSGSGSRAFLGSRPGGSRWPA